MGNIFRKQQEMQQRNQDPLQIQMVLQSRSQLKRYQDNMLNQRKQNISIEDPIKQNARFSLQTDQRNSFTNVQKFDVQTIPQELIQKYINFTRMQIKEQSIEVNFPIISEKSQSIKKKELKKWLAYLCQNVFSIAYQYYKKGQMNQSEMKIYCSENLLMNIIKLSERNRHLTKEDYQFMNTVLKEDILSYFKEKYPPTLQKQSYKQFKSQIQQIDSLDDEEDLIKSSKLEKEFGKRFFEQFKIENIQNIESYDLIMEFINHILQLPDKEGKQEATDKKGEKNKKTHYEEFFQLMTQIFTKVQDINFMRGKKSTEMNQKTEGKINEQQNYRQRVKSYTSYKIGRKIPQHINKFTKQEIQDGDIDIKDPSILRFLTKWLEELEENLDKIQEKLMQAGANLHDWNYGINSDLIKKNRQRLIQQIQSKIYEQQRFCNYAYLKNKEISTVPLNQKIVGVFSCIASQNLSTYILKSINSILKDLCNLTVHHYNGQFSFQSITCKIGDLMRCKCSSKEKEILKIYQQMKDLNDNQPQILKIVRVKNRLEKGTRDILINARFNNTILCEIQLSINSNQSSESILNSFNHYLYQLQRSKFGPINEMASIWSKDQRFDYMVKLLNQKRKKIGYVCCNNPHMIQQKDPFICHYCDIYYPKQISFLPHMKCSKCKIDAGKCSNCIFYEIVKTSKFKEELLKEYPNKEDCIYLDPIDEKIDIPQYGMYLSKTTNKKQFIQFKTFNLIDKKNLYLVKHEEGKNKIIHAVPKNKKLDFLQDKIMFKINQIKQLEQFNETQLKKSLLLPASIKNIYKKQSTALKWTFSQLTVNQFQQITKGDEKKYQKIKQINLCNNSIKDCVQILNRFKNIEILNLRNNGLEEIPKSIGNNVKLKKLEFAQNQIKYLPESIGKLTNLSFLSIQRNKVQNIPSSIGSLIHLTALHIQSNSLKNLPQQIGNLKKLTELMLSDNKLVILPSSIGSLKKLITLQVQSNKLTIFPQWMSNLNNLRTLNLSNNKLKSIPEFIGKLTNLTELYLQNNQLTTLPSQIGNLQSLTQLMINSNKLISLPQTIGNLRKLTKLHVNDNQLANLPFSIGNLQKLTLLQLQNNKITFLPQSIGYLSNLIQLQLYDNQLTTLPQSIGNLQKLKRLYLNNNKILTLPPSMGNLQSLTTLFLNDNQLLSVPQSIGDLQNLTKLQLQNNKLKQIPKLKNIPESLDLSKNQIKVNKLLLQSFFSLRTHAILSGNIKQLSEQDKKWFHQNELSAKIKL